LRVVQEELCCPAAPALAFRWENTRLNLAEGFAAFNLQASPEPLSGGSQPPLNGGNVVLKRVKEPSLQNKHSPELIDWIAAFSHTLTQEGLRFPKALPTKEGRWSTPEGWTAWTVVAGRHSTTEDVAGVRGSERFSKRLRGSQSIP